MKKFKKITILLLLLIFQFSIVIFDNNSLYAKISKSDAEKYLDQVEFKVLKVKNNNVDNHSKDLLVDIENYIEESKYYITKRKYDMAYYMAKLAEEYIELINARIKLQEAIEEYNNAKNK